MRDFFFPDELMYLYPDGVNQCSFSFIMYMPSVSGKQPLGMEIWTKLRMETGIWYTPPSGPSHNIVVILYKYPDCGSDSSIA